MPCDRLRKWTIVQLVGIRHWMKTSCPAVNY
jgi:hypothetical protein